MVCSRLDKIETAVQETKTFSGHAYNCLHELERGMDGVREAVERLRNNMSAFSKGLYRLLTGGSDEGDKPAAVEFT